MKMFRMPSVQGFVKPRKEISVSALSSLCTFCANVSQGDETQYLIGLEYRLFWLCAPSPDAGSAGAGAGVDSLEAALTQLSTTPNSGKADSEPKSRAPNWRFSPGMSAEPGISTAVAGIWTRGSSVVYFLMTIEAEINMNVCESGP